MKRRPDPDRYLALTTSFLTEVFAIPTPGRIELRSGITWRSQFHATPAAAARGAMEADGNVHFGVGRRVGRRRRGGQVLALGAVWVDLDVPELLEDLDDLARARIDIKGRLAAFQVAPSILLSSGRGLHAYWLLTEAADAETVRGINCALVAALGGDAKATDPTRLLRPAGTHNWNYGEPLLVAVEDYWEPGTRARRYAIGDLPRVTTPARRLLVMPELVARVVERAELGRIHADGRATLRCVFHDDRDPSAVVYPTGYWFCSACGISESASLWTRRGEVADWGLAGLVRYAQARRPELPEGHVKAPRSAIKIVAPVIAERATPLRLVRQRVGIRIVDADGKAVRYDDLDRLERDLRQLLGGLTYRVFWAAVALAQRAQRGGRFALETGTIADLLGYEPTTDGRHHTEVRDRVRKAIEALTRVWVRFRWSKGGPTFRGPLLVLHGDIDDRAAVFSLHLGIWRQMSGRSPAWVPWQIEALRLHEDALAVYLRALWEYQDSREGKAGQPLRIRLRDVAERAGVWNEERWTKDRKRYLDEWATRMEPAHGLGFGICYLENEAFLVAEPKLMGRFSRKDGTVFAETTLRSPRRPPTSETLVRVQGTSPLRALPSASPPAPASPLQVVRVLPVSTPASETNLAAALDLLLGKDDDPDHGAPPRHPVGSRSPAV